MTSGISINRLVIITTIILLISSGCRNTREAGILTNKEVKLLTEQLEEAKIHYRKIIEEFPDDQGIPYSYENGELIGVDPSGWTSGFFPGTLWYLFEYSGDDYWKQQAMYFTEKLQEQQFNCGTHDLGFMMYCSYGNAYRLSHDPGYKQVLLNSAESLSTRFSPVTGTIRSWDFPGWWDQYPVIIDNMMNLELLMWATESDGNKKYADIAVSHSLRTMKEHFREDFSSYHVVDYDTLSGKSLTKGTFQGFSDSSSWARGQAWGLYGFAMMGEKSGDSILLSHGMRIADYILPLLENDPVPCWDFSLSEEASEPKDASAAAVMASAFVKLYVLTGKEKYIEASKKIILELSGPEYFAPSDETGDFLLKHSVVHKTAGQGIDVPLNYTDYYYLETLLNLLKLENGLL